MQQGMRSETQYLAVSGPHDSAVETSEHPDAELQPNRTYACVKLRVGFRHAAY